MIRKIQTIHRWHRLLLALAVGQPLAVRAELELRGFCVSDNVTQLSFYDAGSQQSYGWKPVGGTVDGYRIVGYDLKTDTATLERENKIIRLQLKAGVLLKSAPSDPSSLRGTLTMSGQGGRRVTCAAELRFGTDTTVDLGDSQFLVINPSKLPDGNILYQLSLIDRSSGDPSVRTSAPSVTSPPDQAFTLFVEGNEVGFSPATR